MIGIGWIAEVAGWTAFSKWKKRQDDIKVLQLGTKSPQALPIIDGRIRKLAGEPTKLQRSTADRIVKAIRFAVSTQAFEIAVQGLLNPKSQFRKQRRRILEVSTYL